MKHLYLSQLSFKVTSSHQHREREGRRTRGGGREGERMSAQHLPAVPGSPAAPCEPAHVVFTESHELKVPQGHASSGTLTQAVTQGRGHLPAPRCVVPLCSRKAPKAAAEQFNFPPTRQQLPATPPRPVCHSSLQCTEDRGGRGIHLKRGIWSTGTMGTASWAAASASLPSWARPHLAKYQTDARRFSKCMCRTLTPRDIWHHLAGVPGLAPSSQPEAAFWGDGGPGGHSCRHSCRGTPHFSRCALRAFHHESCIHVCDFQHHLEKTLLLFLITSDFLRSTGFTCTSSAVLSTIFIYK